GTASSRTQALLDAHADKLLADPEAIVQCLVDAVDRLFTEHYRELIPRDMKKGLAATRKVILDEWTSLVDILAATSKGKGTTKEASKFTLERLERILSMAVQAYQNAHQQGPVVGRGEPARESGVAETKIAGGEDESVAGDKESAGLDAGSTLRRGD
ncbi:unnamed protein product, partial [Pylaiella littoralis]